VTETFVLSYLVRPLAKLVEDDEDDGTDDSTGEFVMELD
jgi:hypothetical protein